MDQTISQLMIQFESHLLVEKKVKPNTFCAYKNDLRQWRACFHEQRIYTIGALQQSHVDVFIAALKEHHHALTTVQRKLSVFKMFWSFCSQKVTYTLAPLTLSRVESRLPFCCTKEQIQTIIDQAQRPLAKHSLQAIIFTLLLHDVGLTCSEIARLRAHDIDSKKRALVVNGSYIPLSKTVWNIVYEYYQRIGKHVIKQNNYVFLVAGKKIPEHVIIASVKKLIQKNQRLTLNPESFFTRSDTQSPSTQTRMNDYHKAYAKHPRT